MKLKLLVVDHLHPDAHQALKSYSDRLDFEFVSAKDLSAKIATADLLIARSTSRLEASDLERGKRLKLIVMAGVGTDGIDLDSATKKGIVIKNTSDANSTSAAELTVGLLLALSRKIPEAHHLVQSGEWTRKGTAALRSQLSGFELSGKTLGIIGLGRVGKRVARRLRSFEMTVKAFDPYLTKVEAEDFSLVSLEEILETSDIISLHVPLTKETRGMVNASTFQRMNRRPGLINTSRGPVVREQDLLNALDSKQILGYAADVFDSEPLPEGHPFLTHPGVILTPHIGAQTSEAQRNVGLAAIKHVIDFLMT